MERLRENLRTFAARRDWEKFHTPKNLAMALGGETGELLEIFQWLSETEAAEIMRDPHRSHQVEDELADVFLYLTRLADVLGVDLLDATARKMERNEHRYPAERVHGTAIKYSDLPEEP